MSAINFYSIPGTRFSARPAILGGCARFAATLIADEGPRPICCKRAMAQNGLIKQTVNDLPRGEIHVLVDVWKMRYRCTACGASAMHKAKGLDPHAKVSRRLNAYIIRQVYQQPAATLARTIGLDESKMHEVFAEYAERRIAARQKIVPRVLGIDEIKLNGDLFTVFTDVERRRPYEIVRGTSHEAILPVLKELKERGGVEVAVIDMDDTLRKAVWKATLGSAIVADKYHFIKYLGKKLDKYRNKRRKEKKGVGRPNANEAAIKDERFLLLTSEDNLTADETKRLAAFLKAYPGMQEVADAKRRLEKIYYVNRSRESAERLLEDWEASLTSHAAFVFQGVVKHIADWREQILAVFDHPFTAAYTERMNRTIRAINAAGGGYTDKVLRARYILHSAIGDVRPVRSLTRTIPPVQVPPEMQQRRRSTHNPQGKRDKSLVRYYWKPYGEIGFARKLISGKTPRSIMGGFF